MSKINLSSPFTNTLLYFFCYLLEFDILDLVFSLELANHQLAISKGMNSGGSDLYRAFHSEEHSSVFCLVIGSYSDCLVSCFDFFTVTIRNIDSAARFSRVSS